MAILRKCQNLFSLFRKQITPSPKPQPQNIPFSRPPPSPLPLPLPSPSPSPSPQTPSPSIDRNMSGAVHAMKRIPRIKFPNRHQKPSGSVTQTNATPAATEVPSTFFSKSAPSEKTLGGKASLQPKRTPMTQEEIDAIMLGGCL